jgi:coproporphyrinogen III oxidase-like Fe-S oxidoreductase
MAQDDIRDTTNPQASPKADPQADQQAGPQADPQAGPQANDAGNPQSGLKPAVVRLELPFAPVRLGRPEREAVVGWNSARSLAYLQALGREIAANAGQFPDREILAVRLGGGVATNAPAQALSEVYRELRRAVHIAPDASITARAAIHNVSGASMPWMRRIGVGRFDFEILSLDSMDFGRLNRSDSMADLPYVEDSFLHVYAHHNLGFILAYGYDAPNTASFRRSIVAFTRSPACHLVLEPWQGWRVDDMRPADRVGKASPDLEADQLGQAREVLGQAGFVEYAPLRFARPGDEDRFTMLAGSGADVLSFGLGARTRFDGMVSTNTSDWDTYLAHSDDFAAITVGAERIAE